MQFLGLASVATILGVAGVSAASTLRNRTPEATTSEGTVAVADSKPANTTKAATPVATTPVVQQSKPAATDTAPVSAPAPAPAPAAPKRPALGGGYVLVEGKTQLTDSIYAMRAGDSVIVNFDAYGFRTRRSDKLESTLRITLPLVFGQMATASLSSIKEDSLVTNRDVIGSLAATGMVLKLDNGATVRIRTLTRPVTDGPIAIGYLAVIER
jgi:hypothetical protein